MAREKEQSIRAILLILPLMVMVSSLSVHNNQPTKKKDNDHLLPQNTQKTRHYQQTTTPLSPDNHTDLLNDATVNRKNTNIQSDCRNGPLTNACSSEVEHADGSHYTVTETLLLNATAKDAIYLNARPKRQMPIKFRVVARSAKIRRQPKFSGNGRMFQMQEFYHMLKASQRQQQQNQKQVQAEAAAAAQAQSEEGTLSEPRYLPQSMIDPTIDLIYSNNRMKLRRRNLENRESRAIQRFRDHNKNGSALSDEAKRNIFFSKGWGASGSLEMSVSRESPSMSQGMIDKAPYAFTSKHWGPLGKREEEELLQQHQPLPLQLQVFPKSNPKSKEPEPPKPKSVQPQWSPFTSQSWTPLGKRAQEHHYPQSFPFTSNYSWRVAKKSNLPWSQEDALGFPLRNT